MKLPIPSYVQVRRRRRRRSELVQAIAERRDMWGQAIAGIVILSGVGVAVAAPAGQNGGLPSLSETLSNGWGEGLRVGSALVTPSLGLGGTFDSNVFAAPSSTRADWYLGERPALDIQSDWPRNSLSLRAQGDFRQYMTYTRENNNNASFAGIGRIDLAANAYVLTGASDQLLHEDRGALVPVNGINPTQFTVSSGKAGFVIEPSPMGLRLDATIDSYAYNNVLLFNGAQAEETARDHITYALEPRVSYQIQPQYDAFVRAVVNRRQYNSTREPDGLARSVEESAILGSAGYLQTLVRLGLEQNPLSRAGLFGSVGYTNAGFAGSGGSSKLFDLQLGARYEVAANVSAGFAYDFAYRASSSTLPNYSRHIVELSLRGEL